MSYINPETLEVIKKYPQEFFKTAWLIDIKNLFCQIVKRKHIIDEDLYMFKHSRIITHMFIMSMEMSEWYNMNEFIYYENGIVYIIDQNCVVLTQFNMDLNLNFKQETVAFLFEITKLLNELG